MPLLRADSLPNAITEPENVTAPISTPMYISISWIEFSAGVRFVDTAGSMKLA
jgi:hypothetical protein